MRGARLGASSWLGRPHQRLESLGVDHLSLGVRDLETARRFYDAFFAPLGASVSAASDKELAYGPGGRGGHFYLYPVGGERVAGLGAHTAFAAADQAAVDAAYRSAVEQARRRSAPPAPIPISPPATMAR